MDLLVRPCYLVQNLGRFVGVADPQVLWPASGRASSYIHPSIQPSVARSNAAYKFGSVDPSRSESVSVVDLVQQEQALALVIRMHQNPEGLIDNSSNILAVGPLATPTVNEA